MPQQFVAVQALQWTAASPEADKVVQNSLRKRSPPGISSAPRTKFSVDSLPRWIIIWIDFYFFSFLFMVISIPKLLFQAQAKVQNQIIKEEENT